MFRCALFLMTPVSRLVMVGLPQAQKELNPR